MFSRLIANCCRSKIQKFLGVTLFSVSGLVWKGLEARSIFESAGFKSVAGSVVHKQNKETD